MSWQAQAAALIRRRGRGPLYFEMWTWKGQRTALQEVEAALVKDLALTRQLLAKMEGKDSKRERAKRRGGAP
jgi:hypothetical protein